MCVAVTLKPGSYLDLDEVVKMHRNNADGVGIAWAREGAVQWWKTVKVDPEYITKAIAVWKDYPRLVHFRFATAGGARPDLCHPFEIGPLANCRVTGIGSKVMIHNGHWSRWDEVKRLLDRENLLPDGPWSDSRLAAYLAHEDPEWLTALGGKVAVMDGAGEIQRLGSWEQIREGVMVSNTNWQTTTFQRGGYQGYRAWKGWQWTEEEAKAFFEEKAAEEAAAQEAAATERDTPVESRRPVA